MNDSGSVNEKTYSCPQGPLAWLNDIEISKVPYLCAFILLFLSMVLIRQPAFVIEVPYIDDLKFALHEVEELKKFGLASMILCGVSLVSLLVPMMKFFEWKPRWFYVTAFTAIANCGAVAFMLGKKQELLETTLLGYAYELLSIDIKLTAPAWMFVFVNVFLMICSVKMLIDVKKNERVYTI